MFDNYPPDMTYNDLVHVGEYPCDSIVCDKCGEYIDEDTGNYHEIFDEIICNDCWEEMCDEE